jgi:hypothetical protein
MMAKYHLSRSVVQWIDFSVFLAANHGSYSLYKGFSCSLKPTPEKLGFLASNPVAVGLGSRELRTRLNPRGKHGKNPWSSGGPRFWRMPHRTGFLLAEFVAIVHPDALEAFRRLSTERNRTTIFITLCSSNLSLLSPSPTKTENGFHTYVYISNIRYTLW